MMGKTYEACDDSVYEEIKRLVKQYHKPLLDYGVSFHAVFARAESKRNGAEIALKHRGYPVAAQVQVVSLVDRVRGMPDVKITIDGLTWDKLPTTQRAALLDHELEHLELRTSKKTRLVKTDDLGRPCLKVKPHDWELAGFEKVVERHGEASLEAQQVARWRSDFAEQLKLWK